MNEKFKVVHYEDSDKLFYKIALFVENYLFPVLFGYLAFKKFLWVYKYYSEAIPVFYSIMRKNASVQQIASFSYFNAQFLLVLLNLLVMCSLIISRNLRQKPKGFYEIFIPLLCLFFPLFYNLISSLPKNINFLLIPPQLLPYFSLIGSFFSLVGYSIAIIATSNLRYSYAVFVEVRDEIVTRGLYRYVRHPIYLGYVIIYTGLCIVYPYFLVVIFTVIFIGVIIFRAILEEKKLATFSTEYRNYIHGTPFLFPVKFKKKLQ
jgi:protein-S-isoprenylcysteine O-methyltransferase Ste14